MSLVKIMDLFMLLLFSDYEILFGMFGYDNTALAEEFNISLFLFLLSSKVDDIKSFYTLRDK